MLAVECLYVQKFGFKYAAEEGRHGCLAERGRSGISGFRSQSMTPYTARTCLVNLMTVRSSIPPVVILQRP
jgi:hypothetical protein